jgi:hypothetical protein
MGLGKTITMLSTIIRTTAEAKVFGEGEAGSSAILNVEHSVIHSRATLVVVPSPSKVNYLCKA